MVLSSVEAAQQAAQEVHGDMKNPLLVTPYLKVMPGAAQQQQQQQQGDAAAAGRGSTPPAASMLCAELGEVGSSTSCMPCTNVSCHLPPPLPAF